ncbi:endonuclease Q family protein [Patescibacteria group bacterium]|nr:endonuclease Q family protein [Patescibacteria group bacterium]
MQIITDLHIHSKFSRACSPQLTLENISATCETKGVDIVATGDFTHPQWFKEIKEKLIEKEEGLYVLKSVGTGLRPVQNRTGLKPVPTRFILATEISCIYTRDNKCRRLHIVVLAPNLKAVEKINASLEKAGCNLKSDGRPIIGMDVRDLARICLEADEKCMIIPAHIWTPWFAMFGSKSGFDSIEECWGEYATPPFAKSGASKIYAIETGLSSDPQMNWRIKNLDNVAIISNSDAHSLPNIAREANVFELAPSLSRGASVLSYDNICKIIKDKNPKTFLYTIEFYPEEGMYHIDGHRDCKFSCEPAESKRLKNICPVCKKPLVIGVLNRVEKLAEPNRSENYIDKNRIPFKKLIELDKIIAESLNIKSRSSKRVQVEYKNLINNFSNEFEILLNVERADLEKITLPAIAEGILRARQGKVNITPGFDGQYGMIKIFSDKDRKNFQKKLF